MTDTVKPTIKAYQGDIEVGDLVFIEQAWEDESGYFHDEHAIVSKILPDGRLRFRIGNWRTRTAHEQKVQAWLNKFEWRPEDVEKVE